MRIIGTDASLDVCKTEGYVMVEYDARYKFKRDKPLRIFKYLPEYAINESNKNDTLILDVEYSFDGLEELYLENKESIDNFAETNKHVNFENPTIYDLLNLASDLDGYMDK